MIRVLTKIQGGQRMCSSYFVQNRVFLTGEAAHTHSPKVSQGMNTSIQDAFNLGWKIASVVRGCHSPDILETYQEERLPIAQRLLSFDKEIYEAISDEFQPSQSETLAETLQKEKTSASGSVVRYRPNMLVTRTYNPRMVPSFLKVGSALPDLQIMNHSDSHMWRLHSLLNNSAHWTLLVFGGNISSRARMNSLEILASQLSQPCSTLSNVNRRYGHHGFGGVETFLIHSASRHGIELHSLPAFFVPRSETLGFDYWKVFVDNASFDGIGGTVYRDLHIPVKGCMVLVRPDHHIAFYGGFDEVMKLEALIKRLWRLDGEALQVK